MKKARYIIGFTFCFSTLQSAHALGKKIPSTPSTGSGSSSSTSTSSSSSSTSSTSAPSSSSSSSSTTANPADYVISYIGDSHSDYYGNARGAFGFLGQRLKELMDADAFSFSLYAASGSLPTWWFNDTSSQAATWGYTQTAAYPPERNCYRGSQEGTCVPKLADVLKNQPDLFVIEQGTNMLGYSQSSIISQIQTMLTQIRGKTKSCLWVAAPNARTSVHSQSSQDQLAQLTQQYASKECYVYDSRYLPRTNSQGLPALDGNGKLIMDVPQPYSPDSNNDGEHFGMTAAGKWAQGVAWMIENIRSQSTR